MFQMFCREHDIYEFILMNQVYGRNIILHYFLWLLYDQDCVKVCLIFS